MFGSPPKVAGQPQNILVLVFSSTWTSRPIAGSYDASASSKESSSPPVRHRAHLLVQLLGIEHPTAPLLLEQGLQRSADAVEPVVGHRGSEHLEADRQVVLRGEPGRHREPRDAGQVGRDGGDVVEVHRQRVVELLPQPERGRRRGRGDEHVGPLEGTLEVAADQRAHLLRLPVVGVVVAARQRVGAQDDAALDLVAEALVARRAHDLLGARRLDALGQHPQAVAHRVEAREVGGRLARHDQVVRRQRVHEVRAGDLHDLGPGLDEQLDGLVEALLHAGLVALAAELGDHPDAQPAQVAGRPGVGRVGHQRDRLVDARGVERVVPADDLVQQRGVEDGARDRAGLVERVGHRDQPVARDPAVGRLGPDRAGHRPRLADRATGVGADRERRHEGGDRRGGAAAGAAGDAVEVPRVAGRAVGRVLGGGAHRELVHVGLAEDREPGLLELADHRGVVRRDPALEDLRAARRRQSLGGEHVLDRDRYAVEARADVTCRTTLVGLPRSGQGALGVDVQEGMHLGVDGRDPVEERLR